VALGLAPGSVRLQEHDETWSVAFAAERERLNAALAGHGCVVEHIGSTAVPSLLAKPILDIAVGCPESTSATGVGAILETLGYEYLGDFGNEGGRIFVRGSDGHRTHHVHVIKLTDPQWSAYLELRDLLRKDADARDAYAAEKLVLAATFSGDRASYTAAKTGVIKRLLRRARSAAGRANG
jgi:GrpB-like predicted nucleotidyltransferase (UPF0157 family)